MDTERLSPRSLGLDAWEPSDILDAMIEGQFAAVAAVRAARPALERAALALAARLGEGDGRLVYAGAGTSGRLAVQDGAELPPTFNWPAERLLLLIAGGTTALLQSVEGAEDEAADAVEMVRRHAIGREDVLIAVAASGTTPFTLACLDEARRRHALTIALANNAGAPLLERAEHPILLDTGPETIAGSTRLKAGTAQKIALNCLSSLAMIQLGRVHDGLMVDVQAGNAKLARRAEEMLTRLTGRRGAEARDALAQAGGSVKVAVLILRGYGVEEAAALLERVGGSLRAALDLIERRVAEGIVSVGERGVVSGGEETADEAGA